MKKHKPIILGIDPGYDRIGWAIGLPSQDKPQILDFGCIQTNKNSSLVERYQLTESRLTEIITKHQPQELAIETLFFSVNKKTALQVSEARGMILGCCARHQLDIFEYHPNQIKLAVTGDGHADKTGVEKMIRLQLKIPHKKIIDDAIDAMAIVFTHMVTRI
ncbi:crossover junction endodeoxyribonuclease RuvC [Patescibacteria group bacterium]|nr:crossover junction endodeoxyribonuclease RuvC [Patescibacteria group bacterium]MBU1967356.1 crossover junction endodeoxyribonuclease RuvC [Patescibacteria group bacterium]